MNERQEPAGEARSEEPRQSYGEAVREAAPGLARIYASMWWRTAEWTVGSSLRAGSRVLKGALSGRSPGDLVQTAEEEVREYARQLFGGEVAGDHLAGRSGSAGSRAGDDEPTTSALRERGAELLRRSADVHYEEDVHPAYARILEVLAPDEARILRLLALSGPQPSVDVRAGLPLVSELVAPGRSMIAAEAGCRHPDRVHAYLNNLDRLGLTWFSREPVSERLRYQVVEAQPEVLEAMRKGGRTARTVRRSILLTPFGKDFCDLCLPLDTIEIDALPDSDGNEPAKGDPPMPPDAGQEAPRVPPDLED
jgi:hypothetical protein